MCLEEYFVNTLWEVLVRKDLRMYLEEYFVTTLWGPGTYPSITGNNQTSYPGTLEYIRYEVPY